MSGGRLILLDLEQRGIRLWLDNGELKYSGRPGCMSEMVRREIISHKSSIIAELMFERTSALAADDGAALKRSTSIIEPSSKVDRNSTNTLPLHTSKRDVDTFLNRFFFLDRGYDISILRAAIDELSLRQKILRTKITFTGTRCYVRYEPNSVPTLILVDEGTFIESATIDEILSPYVTLRKASDDNPAIQFFLLRGGAKAIFGFCLDPAVGDVESLKIIVQELSELYRAKIEGRSARLPNRHRQYLDYLESTRNWLKSDQAHDALSHWRRKLNDFAIAGGPNKLSRTLGATITVPSETTGILNELGQRYRTDMSSILFVAQAMALCRMTGNGDVAIGTSVPGRFAHDLRSTVGNFSHICCRVFSINRSCSFLDALSRYVQASIEARQYDFVLFDMIRSIFLAEGRNLFLPTFSARKVAATDKVDDLSPGWKKISTSHLQPPSLISLTGYPCKLEFSETRTTISYQAAETPEFKGFSELLFDTIERFSRKPDAVLSMLS